MIIRLNRLDENARKKIIQTIKDLHSGKYFIKYPKPNSFYRFGLRFSIEDLQRIGWNIIFLPLELMAEYADQITVKYIDKNDENFICSMLEANTIEFEHIKQKINATAIGNAAYCVLYSKNVHLQSACETLLLNVYIEQLPKLLQQYKP